MGLFGKKDELFEIMARGSARKQAGEPTSQAVARQSERASPALKQPKTSGAWPKASGAWPKPNRSSRSWRRGGEPAAEELFLEVDGDAIVLVDDGFVDGLEAEDGPEVPTFAIRTDTAVVGGILACSLLAAAFFMGRT